MVDSASTVRAQGGHAAPIVQRDPECRQVPREAQRDRQHRAHRRQRAMPLRPRAAEPREDEEAREPGAEREQAMADQQLQAREAGDLHEEESQAQCDEVGPRAPANDRHVAARQREQWQQRERGRQRHRLHQRGEEQQVA